MKIWVDADACPVVIKEILFKASIRTKVELTFIANQYIQTPVSPYIQSIKVSPGFDVADNEIVKRVNKGDLVITGDIPLAAKVMEKGAEVLTPRGEKYSADNIRARLNMRDFMDTLRSSGIYSAGSPPLGQKERQSFANNLDRYLTKLSLKIVKT